MEAESVDEMMLSKLGSEWLCFITLVHHNDVFNERFKILNHTARGSLHIILVVTIPYIDSAVHI
jgi:hypothetical protein